MTKPNLVIEKIFPDAKLPEKQHPNDSGFDLFIHRFVKGYLKNGVTESEYSFDDSYRHECKDLMIEAGDRILVGTGIRAYIDVQTPQLIMFQYNFDMVFELQIRPRSGTAFKRGLTVINTPGTVDKNYTGEIFIAIINQSNKFQTLEIGERIAQLVPVPVLLPTLKENVIFKDTDRGDGGFNSTGKN